MARECSPMPKCMLRRRRMTSGCRLKSPPRRQRRRKNSSKPPKPSPRLISRQESGIPSAVQMKSRRELKPFHFPATRQDIPVTNSAPEAKRFYSGATSSMSRVSSLNILRSRLCSTLTLRRRWPHGRTCCLSLLMRILSLQVRTRHFQDWAVCNEMATPTVGLPWCLRSSGLQDRATNLADKHKTKKGTKHMSNNNGQKLAGKVAVVTGGSRSIGAAIAKRLAADGASVAITYTKGADAAASVVKEIEGVGRKAIAIQADAADADAVEAAVEKTVAKFGRLDVLVNNAGSAIPKRFEETTLEELDRLIGINVRGVFVATQAALKRMQSGGRIIMIGSAVGERALTSGLVPYSATKGAVKMFAQGLSREVGSRGITVNNIQPGPIDTDANPAAGEWAVPQKAFTALDRYGRVDEVAALVAFVAGPESSYITGANLTVDGGMIA